MRLSGVCVGAALALAVVAGPAAERATARTTEPADFLEALAGEWSVVSEAKPGPDQEAVRIESRESARLVGGRWLVAETTGAAGGASFTSILTLGYDAADGHFVGTWISGRQDHLWSYTGTLDESGTRLTLETEGPILGNPERTTRYREIIEIAGPDTKVMTSMILGPDGEWFEFQRAEYRRSGAAASAAGGHR